MNPTDDKSLEFQIIERKYRRIGWAIIHMTWLEKLRWVFGGTPRYMSNKYWDNCDE